jgi:hypothetical protein
MISALSWIKDIGSGSHPRHVEAEHPIDDDWGLPADLLSGYGAVEIKLTELLRPRCDEDR